MWLNWSLVGTQQEDPAGHQLVQYAQEDDVQSTLLSLKGFSWTMGGRTRKKKRSDRERRRDRDFGELH